eukprot:g643.t1
MGMQSSPTSSFDDLVKLDTKPMSLMHPQPMTQHVDENLSGLLSPTASSANALQSGKEQEFQHQGSPYAFGSGPPSLLDMDLVQGGSTSNLETDTKSRGLRRVPSHLLVHFPTNDERSPVMMQSSDSSFSPGIMPRSTTAAKSATGKPSRRGGRKSRHGRRESRRHGTSESPTKAILRESPTHKDLGDLFGRLNMEDNRRDQEFSTFDDGRRRKGLTGSTITEDANDDDWGFFEEATSEGEESMPSRQQEKYDVIRNHQRLRITE